MEAGSLMSCEWCGAPLAQPAPAAPPGPAALPYDAPVDEWEEGTLFQRLRKAAWALITSPVGAAEGGLEPFFNSPGAPRAVIACFMLALLLEAVTALIEPHGSSVSVLSILLLAVFNVVYGIVWVAFTALVVAGFNAINAGADGFRGEFGALALWFAFIEAVTTIAVIPLTLGLELASPSGAAALAWVVGLWRWVLQIIVVEAATGLNWWQAILLLAVANALLAWGLIGALSAALHV